MEEGEVNRLSVIDRWTAVFSFIMCDISQLPSVLTVIYAHFIWTADKLSHNPSLLLLENEMGFSVFTHQIDSKWIGGTRWII